MLKDHIIIIVYIYKIASWNSLDKWIWIEFHHSPSVSKMIADSNAFIKLTTLYENVWGGILLSCETVNIFANVTKKAIISIVW